MKNYLINSLWHTEQEAKKLCRPDTKILVYEEFRLYEEVACDVWDNLN